VCDSKVFRHRTAPEINPPWQQSENLAVAHNPP